MRRPEDDLRNVEELCVRFGMSADEGAKLVWLEHQLNLAKRYQPSLESDLQEARAELERLNGILDRRTEQLSEQVARWGRSDAERVAAERDLAEAREQLAQVRLSREGVKQSVRDARHALHYIAAHANSLDNAQARATDCGKLLDTTREDWERALYAAPTAQSAPANSEGARFECDDCAVGRDCPEHDAAPSANVQAWEPSDPSVQRRAVVALLYADDEPTAQPRAEERAHEPLGPSADVQAGEPPVLTEDDIRAALRDGVKDGNAALKLARESAMRAPVSTLRLGAAQPRAEERAHEPLGPSADVQAGEPATEERRWLIARLRTAERYHAEHAAYGGVAGEHHERMQTTCADALAELLTEPTGATTGETDGKR